MQKTGFDAQLDQILLFFAPPVFPFLLPIPLPFLVCSCCLCLEILLAFVAVVVQPCICGGRLDIMYEL